MLHVKRTLTRLLAVRFRVRPPEAGCAESS